MTAPTAPLAPSPIPAAHASPLRRHALPVAGLLLLFLWIYGRVVFRLNFAMDDFIHSAAEMTGPLGPTLRDVWSGALSWSGYRPLSTSMRVVLTHLFGLDLLPAYYIVYLGLHAANALLAYRLVWRVGRSVIWAFIAAALFLLLPSHNEAVFWFAANANPLALLFCLIALDGALTLRTRPGLGRELAVLAAYVAAVLSYEVVILLPLLLFAADWLLTRRLPRARLRLYLLLALAAVALLALRLALQAGLLGLPRADYAFALDPAHIARNFGLLASQMVLLYNSPYPGAPLFAYSRTWLQPTSPLALTTLALALLLCALVFVAASDKTSTDFRRATVPLGWLGWGILWCLLLGLPFAMLTGRNPENRYTYILGFGLAVAFTALLALLDALIHRRAARAALLGLAAGVVAFYAFTSAGDAADWAAAGDRVQQIQAQVQQQIPALEPDQAIGQLAIPARIGSAYLYSVERAWQDAMFLLYRTGRPGFAANLSLRDQLLATPDAPQRTYAFVWDDARAALAPMAAAILCTTPEECTFAKLRRPDGAGLNSSPRYVQIFDPQQPERGGVSLIATLSPHRVLTCYPFGPDGGGAIDPAALAAWPTADRCADALSAFWDYTE